MSAEPAGREFFVGRTITYIVATNPGGGYDTYARLIARHLERHLGGARVVVKNVPGAANIVGANELYAASPDGLTLGTFTIGLVYSQMVGEPGVRFDLGRLSWIGKAATDPRVLTVGAGATLTRGRNVLRPSVEYRRHTEGTASLEPAGTMLSFGARYQMVLSDRLAIVPALRFDTGNIANNGTDVAYTGFSVALTARSAW